MYLTNLIILCKNCCRKDVSNVSFEIVLFHISLFVIALTDEKKGDNLSARVKLPSHSLCFVIGGYLMG